MAGTAMAAEIPMPDDALQRYAQLEQAYVGEQWASLRGKGEALLEALELSDDPQAEALAYRVHVLMGHAHLYFLGEVDVAEDHYRAVLSGNAESELRRIAAEGLEQCQSPEAVRAAADRRSAASNEDQAAEAGPEGSEPLREADTAVGGSAAGVGPEIAPASEEAAATATAPTSIAAREEAAGEGMAQEAGAPEDQQSAAAGIRGTGLEESGAGAPGPEAEPGEPAAAGATTATGAGGEPAGSMPFQTQPGGIAGPARRAASPIPEDPFQAALAAAASAGTGGRAPNQAATPWLQDLASATGPAPSAGAGSEPEAATSPPGSVEAEAPRLSLEKSGTPGTAEAAESPLEAMAREAAASEGLGLMAVDTRAEDQAADTGDANVAAIGTARADAASDEAGAALAAETAGALAPRLEVEVVEEPELLEVAQADPELAEELDLELQRIRERRAAAREPASEPLAELISAASSEVSTDEAGLGQERQQEENAGAISPEELRAPTLQTEEPELQASGAMGASVEQPTQPAAPDLSAEDPELVAGLLRVVIRA